MPFAVIRLFFFALPLLFVSELNAQTATPQDGATNNGRRGSWKVVYEENFEDRAASFKTGSPSWSADTYQNTDEYSDGGGYYRALGVKPPEAFRAEGSFGRDSWLSVATYSRSNLTKFGDLFQVVPDPADPHNHVLKISSPRHTDGIVVRSTSALPKNYRVCLKVGFASFGDGKPGPGSLNGYAGGETDEPWSNGDASLENGFYWLTILDATPRPHNNLWIHHHRKVTIDSDNNKEAWTNIWEGKNWVADGQHPIMMFGVDKDGDDNDSTGRPFLSWSHGSLQPSGAIRAVDAYKDNTWYSACIERNEMPLCSRPLETSNGAVNKPTLGRYRCVPSIRQVPEFQTSSCLAIHTTTITVVRSITTTSSWRPGKITEAIRGSGEDSNLPTICPRNIRELRDPVGS